MFQILKIMRNKFKKCEKRWCFKNTSGIWTHVAGWCFQTLTCKTTGLDAKKELRKKLKKVERACGDSLPIVFGENCHVREVRMDWMLEMIFFLNKPVSSYERYKKISKTHFSDHKRPKIRYSQRCLLALIYVTLPTLRTIQNSPPANDIK